MVKLLNALTCRLKSAVRRAVSHRSSLEYLCQARKTSQVGIKITAAPKYHPTNVHVSVKVYLRTRSSRNGVRKKAWRPYIRTWLLSKKVCSESLGKAVYSR